MADSLDNFASNKFKKKFRGSFEDFVVKVPSKRIGRKSSETISSIKSSSIYLDSYNFISNDIWMHISEHVEPEDVLTFALICRQTAALVKSTYFWINLFNRYCKQTGRQDCILPDNLKNIAIRNLGFKKLRCYVIQKLFYCHVPFLHRIQIGYTLDNLVGRSYVSSWHKQWQCIWIMCYKFWNNLIIEKDSNIIPTANEWESLLEEDFPDRRNAGNPFEGVFLLIICCNRYIPFNTNLLYDYPNGEGHTRLIATRELLTKDIQSINLELDFQDSLKNSITTVRYPSILKFKVLPWWHPDFKTFCS